MKALIFENVGKFIIEEIPEVELFGPSWVKVKVQAVGICGTDLHKFFYESPPAEYLKTKILGHEIAGLVAECGDEVKGFAVGNRVAIEPLLPCTRCTQCRRGRYQLCPDLQCIGRDLPGGFAEYVCARQDQLYLLPPHVSFAEGSLIDPVAVAVHCIHSLDLNKRNWSVAIVGDGPIGLICLQVMKAFGAGSVTLFGKYKYRLKLASNLGASEAVLLTHDNSKLESFKERFDVVIEAVGGRQSKTLRSCINLVAPGGVVVVLGVFDFDFLGSLHFRQMFFKEARILGSNSYSTWERVREFETAKHLVADGLVDVKQLVTHKLSLDQFYEGFTLTRKKNETRVIKVIFEPCTAL
ncbi:MAG: alcohol dehydrogenase catalytic domain-containing protein [Thermodesulfobacteriota bacterium]